MMRLGMREACIVKYEMHLMEILKTNNDQTVLIIIVVVVQFWPDISH